MDLRKISLLGILIGGLVFHLAGQSIVPSSAKCRLVLKDSSVDNYNSNLAYLQVDEGNKEIRVRLDFSTFITDNDSADDGWLHKTEKKVLRFKGTFPVEFLTSLSNQEVKEFTSTGELSINQFHYPCSIRFMLIHTEKGKLTVSNPGENPYPVRLAFSVRIDPDTYKINFKKHSIAVPITITVGNGTINKYGAGIQNVLQLPH